MRKVYIRYREDLPATTENFSALTGFRRRGIETAPFFGDIPTDLSEDVGVFGFIGDTWAALDSLGIDRPEPIDYPEPLRWLMGRDLTVMPLSDAMGQVGKFIKPVNHKLFTGFVNNGSFLSVSHCNLDEPCWVVDAIEFLSEYRCFVLNGEVLGIKHYKGDECKAINRDRLNGAVDEYTDAPVAYTIDLGVTSSGTALIEVNDSLSFGTYGLDPVLYSKMLEARWKELLGQWASRPRHS